MSDFKIENGFLIWYTRRAADVVIPDSVTTIGKLAFNHCTDLTSIALPGIVATIGEAAFQGCTGLTDIILPDNGINSKANRTQR